MYVFIKRKNKSHFIFLDLEKIFYLIVIFGFNPILSVKFTFLI